MPNPSALITAAIEATGLSRLALAEAIGSDPTTLRRWAAGTRAMPGPAVAVLRIMAAHPEVVASLR
jgi:DNA-binding transcriptional regulator YiaG